MLLLGECLTTSIITLLLKNKDSGARIYRIPVSVEMDILVKFPDLLMYDIDEHISKAMKGNTEHYWLKDI